MVKIEGFHGTVKTSMTQAAGKKRTKKSSRSSTSDTVQVSEASALRERAKVLLANMPEARLDRIESIRDSLEKGTYVIDERRMAAQIVANALSERPW